MDDRLRENLMREAKQWAKDHEQSEARRAAGRAKGQFKRREVRVVPDVPFDWDAVDRDFRERGVLK